MEYGTMIDVGIEGLADLQFDRFTGKPQEDITLSDQLYIDEDGGLIMPAVNVLSFFYSICYPSALTMFWANTKTRKIVGQAFKATVFVSPMEIPILRKGKQVIPGEFTKNKYGKLVDDKAKMWVDTTIPKPPGKAGVIPNPHKKRPTLRMPWSMNFQIQVFELEGSDVTVDLVESWLNRGGLMIGVGTHRPMFGRFKVAKFVPRKK